MGTVEHPVDLTEQVRATLTRAGFTVDDASVASHGGPLITYDLDEGTALSWITAAELTIRAQRARHEGHQDSADLAQRHAICSAIHTALLTILSQAGHTVTTTATGDIAVTGSPS
ncbi:hypothetical protein OG607_10905 [Streptomyces sp. NBC_01537]|uniref:hypothetical protein n=1 Tax=Streptomyces sp. NBC_01537 TaxID=2903896 RepID=UPI003864B21D